MSAYLIAQNFLTFFFRMNEYTIFLIQYKITLKFDELKVLASNSFKSKIKKIIRFANF